MFLSAPSALRAALTGSLQTSFPDEPGRCPLGRQQIDREPRICREKVCFEPHLCPQLALILHSFAHMETQAAL